VTDTWRTCDANIAIAADRRHPGRRQTRYAPDRSSSTRPRYRPSRKHGASWLVFASSSGSRSADVTNAQRECGGICWTSDRLRRLLAAQSRSAAEWLCAGADPRDKLADAMAPKFPCRTGTSVHLPVHNKGHPWPLRLASVL